MTEEVQLVEISRPRQWPTLSRRELKSGGYPVYGANGKIGFADEYTHERPTIIIGCRGSCGTLHITEPKSYVNGNAMALDDLDISRVHQKYLFHFLAKRGFEDVISGSSQPQITGKSLMRVVVPLPTLNEQTRIAAILDKADAIRLNRKVALSLADELLKAIFLEMFGDPATNPKKIRALPIKELGSVVTGNTPPRNNAENYGNGIEWIKSDNINTPSHFLTTASERLSAIGERICRSVPAGSTLVTCIAGSPDCIGNAAMADRAVAFNQQINAIIPGQRTHPYFLYAQILVAKKLIQRASTNSMKGMVSKGKFQEIELLAPNYPEQCAFGEIFQRAIASHSTIKAASEYDQNLFYTLSQRAFRGEL